jgi:hypothetical protein
MNPHDAARGFAVERNGSRWAESYGIGVPSCATSGELLRLGLPEVLAVLGTIRLALGLVDIVERSHRHDDGRPRDSSSSSAGCQVAVAARKAGGSEGQVELPVTCGEVPHSRCEQAARCEWSDGSATQLSVSAGSVTSRQSSSLSASASRARFSGSVSGVTSMSRVS